MAIVIPFHALSAPSFILFSLFELDVNTCTSRKVGRGSGRQQPATYYSLY